MTYRELNDLFSKIWADKHGIIASPYAELPYEPCGWRRRGWTLSWMSPLLAAELKKAGLTLMREGEENDLNCVRG